MKKFLAFTLIGCLLLGETVLLAGCFPVAGSTDNTPARQTPPIRFTEPAVPEKTLPSTPSPLLNPTPTRNADYKNITCEIDGRQVALVNGAAEVPAAPESSAKIIISYFGNEAFGDLNGDGREDAAFLVTQSGVGSGTFFFVVAALQTETGYQGTNAVFLGDRIAPQSTLIQNGQVVVNYADRKPGEPFTTAPSVGITKTFKVDNGMLAEVSR